MTVFVYQTKNASEEFAGLCAIVMADAMMVIFVRTEYVSKVVAMKMPVMIMRLV